MNDDLLCENSAVRHVDPYLTAKVVSEMAQLPCMDWMFKFAIRISDL
jgi:hypothetical protein